MARVLVYTTHGKPFRVPMPGGGVLTFGPTPEEFDLSDDELRAIEARRKTCKSLEVKPLSRRAAEQIGELAEELAAAQARAASLEAELGGRIAELEAELDQANERAHSAGQRAALEIAKLEGQLVRDQQLEHDRAAALNIAQQRSAELEQALAQAKKDIARLEAQKKR